MEFIIVLLIVAFIVLYRKSNGESLYKFVTTSIGNVYDKYAPYSFKVIRESFNLSSFSSGKEEILSFNDD